MIRSNMCIYLYTNTDTYWHLLTLIHIHILFSIQRSPAPMFLHFQLLILIREISHFIDPRFHPISSLGRLWICASCALRPRLRLFLNSNSLHALFLGAPLHSIVTTILTWQINHRIIIRHDAFHDLVILHHLPATYITSQFSPYNTPEKWIMIHDNILRILQ